MRLRVAGPINGISSRARWRIRQFPTAVNESRELPSPKRDIRGRCHSSAMMSTTICGNLRDESRSAKGGWSLLSRRERKRERERETWRSPAILSWRRCLAECDPRAKFCVSQSNQSFVYSDACETSNTSQEPCLKTSTARRAPKTTDGNTSRAEIEGWTRRSGGQQGRREGCAEHGVTGGERDERTRPQHLFSNARSGKVRKFLIEKFENLKSMKRSLSTINLKYYSRFSCINKIITF